MHQHSVPDSTLRREPGESNWALQCCKHQSPSIWVRNQPHWPDLLMAQLHLCQSKPFWTQVPNQTTLQPRKAHTTRANIFSITECEIVGARKTTMSAFASFTLKIGGMHTKCYAYILESNRQFHDNLLLGWSWLKQHNACPRWNEDTHSST